MAKPPPTETRPPPKDEAFEAARRHWIIVLLGVIVATVVGTTGFLAWLDQRFPPTPDPKISALPETVEKLANRLGDLEERTSQVPVSTFTAKLVLEPGQSDISELTWAVANQRTIYISYTNSELVEDHRWLRRCDHVVIDPIQARGAVVSCFILRVPDTQITETGRTMIGMNIFEDHIVTSEGEFEVRKYSMEGDTFTLLPVEGNSNRYPRDAWWFAAPMPETDN